MRVSNRPQRTNARANAFRVRMAARDDSATTLLVSHWAFILALTGRSIENGEILRWGTPDRRAAACRTVCRVPRRGCLLLGKWRYTRATRSERATRARRRGAPCSRFGYPYQRVAALAVLETLNADLLSHDSATITLEHWCEVHRLASPPLIVAVRVSGVDKPASPEQRRELRVAPTAARCVIAGCCYGAALWYCRRRTIGMCLLA